MKNLLEVRKNEYIFEKVILMIFLLFIFKFFYLIDYNTFLMKYTIDNRLYLPIIFSVIVSIGYIFFKNVKIQSFIFSKSIIIYFYFIIMDYLITYIRYSNIEKMKDIIAPNSYYFAIIIYFPLAIIINNNKKIENFLNYFTIFSIIISLIFLLQNYIYISTGEFFLKIPSMFDGQEFIANYRNFGNLRMGHANSMVSISMAISLGILFSKNKFKEKLTCKILHLINIIVGYWYLIFIDQTRAMLIVMIILLLYNIFTNKTFDWKYKGFYITLIFFVGFFLVISKQDYIQEIFKYSKTEHAYSYRKTSYYYYFKSVITNIFGIGMISDTTSYGFELIHGPFGNSYFSDVGIIGTASKLGLYVAIWYLHIILKILKYALSVKRKQGNNIGINLSILLIGTLPTLSMLDSPRIYMLPICMILVEKLNNYYKVEGAQI